MEEIFEQFHSCANKSEVVHIFSYNSHFILRIIFVFSEQSNYSKTKFQIEPKLLGFDYPWKRMRTSSDRLQVLPRGTFREQVLEEEPHLHGGHSLPLREVLV